MKCAICKVDEAVHAEGAEYGDDLYLCCGSINCFCSGVRTDSKDAEIARLKAELATARAGICQRCDK